MARSLIDLAIAQAWPEFPVPSHHRSPFVIAARRLEMERIAGPIRELFAMLEAGEAYEAGGAVVMRAIDSAEGWMEVVPALGGWIDCIARLLPNVPCRALGQLLRFVSGGLPISPALAMQARVEFEAQALQVVQARAADVRSAVVGAQVAWEFERLGLV